MHIFQYPKHIFRRISLVHQVEHSLVRGFEPKQHRMEPAVTQPAANFCGKSAVKPQISIISQMHPTAKDSVGHLFHQPRMDGVVDKLKGVDPIPLFHLVQN